MTTPKKKAAPKVGTNDKQDELPLSDPSTGVPLAAALNAEVTAPNAAFGWTGLTKAILTTTTPGLLRKAKYLCKVFNLDPGATTLHLLDSTEGGSGFCISLTPHDAPAASIRLWPRTKSGMAILNVTGTDGPQTFTSWAECKAALRLEHAKAKPVKVKKAKAAPLYTAEQREEVVARLVDDWMESIAQEGGSVIDTILRKGFAGYEKYTDQQLRKEYADAFGDGDSWDAGDE